MIRPTRVLTTRVLTTRVLTTRVLTTVGAVALAAIASGCTASTPGPTAGTLAATPPEVVVTRTLPPTPAATTTKAPVSAPTSVAPVPRTTATTRPAARTTVAPASPVVPTSMAGRWTVHGVTIDVRPDGSGVLYVHDCSPKLPACTVGSDLVVRPSGAGLRLTVQGSFALDKSDRRVALPAGYDLAANLQAPGDYSVLQPFTAADWPYDDIPFSSALAAHVYDWRMAHAGAQPAATTDSSARLIRDVEHLPQVDGIGMITGA